MKTPAAIQTMLVMALFMSWGVSYGIYTNSSNALELSTLTAAFITVSLIAIEVVSRGESEDEY